MPCWVTGNLIGAGILALPMQTGGAGLLYSFLAMVLFCGAMYDAPMSSRQRSLPTICKDMEWDLPAISRAMLIGMLIGFVMNLVWVMVEIGVLPLTLGSN